MGSRCLSKCSVQKSLTNYCFLKPGNVLASFGCKTGGKCDNLARTMYFSNGFRLKSAVHIYPLVRASHFLSSSSQKAVEGSAGKPLPWLAARKTKEEKRPEKLGVAKNGQSPWEESAEKFLKGGASTVKEVEVVKETYKEEQIEEENDVEIEDVEDPRWYKIKNRFDKVVNVKKNPERPEVRKWSKLENWGKKTWKEATESKVPRMVGESLYGVGPVLAALSAGRREFYALYIQEGLDLSGNNRRKKDKKGFEKILRIAERVGLKKLEISKHDLNMIVDNRPHQGLVLDSSPLEMVNIKELEPVSDEGGKSHLWVALDEVTDPQNLGAIIRSAYFFGASGMVLCAKNSAPLSGVVSKASAGSLELMEVRSCKNMMQFLASSAENGWRVLGGSVSSRAIPLNEVKRGEPTILVLGSEGTGLRPLVERSCTELVRIPGKFEDEESAVVDHGGSGEDFQSFLAVESLNVSVATGVFLHHLISNGE